MVMNNKFLRTVSFALGMNFLLSLLSISSFIFCEEQKQSMKILMVVACFPKIHDTCMLDQMTGLIDRGHEVHIFAFKKGDCIHVQEDVIKYDLINKTIFERLPDCLDEYDIIMFQLGHKLFDVRQKHNYRGKIVVCLIGYDITGFLRQKHMHMIHILISVICFYLYVRRLKFYFRKKDALHTKSRCSIMVLIV